jgi:hypothetical protein
MLTTCLVSISRLAALGFRSERPERMGGRMLDGILQLDMAGRDLTEHMMKI